MKPYYPGFDHNGKCVAAINRDAVKLTVGQKVHLSYRIDERGNGRYILRLTPLSKRIAYNNVIETPDTTGVVRSQYNDSVFWVDKETE